jgi:hypothetical protein
MKDKFNMVGNEINEFALPCYSDDSNGAAINIRTFKGSKNVVVILLRDIR